jgi:hypothetical protein
VFYEDGGNRYYRDTTLNTEDTINTGDPLPTTSGQTRNNWTKR